MTTAEITARIEKCEIKIERAAALIEKCEIKAAALKQQAAAAGIIFPENARDLWLEIRGEVEAKFAGRPDELNAFYWDIVIKFKNYKEQANDNRKKIDAIAATISELRARLAGKTKAEIEFAVLPQIIKDFLADWQRRAIEFYMTRHDNSKNDMFRYRSAEYIEKAIQQEAQDKGIEIASRVADKCGQIVNAAGIKIGANGSINGLIIGTNGSAEVETIFAGGYNVQCLHFRVLVK